MKSVGLASVMAAALLSPIAAQAATAYTDNQITLHAGPGTTYPTIEQISPETRVWIMGCRAQRDWCDVSHGRARGWVRADRLTLPDPSRMSDAIPVATFDLNQYWDENYKHEAFYADRDRWHRASSQVAENADR